MKYVFRGECDYRQGINWILDLLTICTHHSELHLTVHCQPGVLAIYSLAADSTENTASNNPSIVA
jgi:hypothetical protein